ncbi:MAG TPA: hypothetical protein VGF85_09510 [Opitutaceae bacterium]|jgi:hypothetical protein
MTRAAFVFAAGLVAGCASRPDAVQRRSVDEGYLLGEADAIKRLYWAKQALEAARSDRPAGKIEYYIWEESGISRDGRKLAPETVAVPVFIPDPAPSGAKSP